MGYKDTNKPENQGNLIKPINSGAYISDNCTNYNMLKISHKTSV